jgi:hypothetical protein
MELDGSSRLATEAAPSRHSCREASSTLQGITAQLDQALEGWQELEPLQSGWIPDQRGEDFAGGVL